MWGQTWCSDWGASWNWELSGPHDAKSCSGTDSVTSTTHYAAYCTELNQQAHLEGMASSVARINSVGLKLAMKQLTGQSTVAALASSMWNWEDLDCGTMFPECDLGLGTTKVEWSWAWPGQSWQIIVMNLVNILTLVNEDDRMWRWFFVLFFPWKHYLD